MHFKNIMMIALSVHLFYFALFYYFSVCFYILFCTLLLLQSFSVCRKFLSLFFIVFYYCSVYLYYYIALLILQMYLYIICIYLRFSLFYYSVFNGVFLAKGCKTCVLKAFAACCKNRTLQLKKYANDK